MFRLLLLGCMETAFAFAFLVSLVYGSGNTLILKRSPRDRPASGQRAPALWSLVASDTESRQSHLLFENGTAASSALSSSQISGFGSNGGEMNETKKLFDVTPLANDTGEPAIMKPRRSYRKLAFRWPVFQSESTKACGK